MVSTFFTRSLNRTESIFISLRIKQLIKSKKGVIYKAGFGPEFVDVWYISIKTEGTTTEDATNIRS